MIEFTKSINKQKLDKFLQDLASSISDRAVTGTPSNPKNRRKYKLGKETLFEVRMLDGSLYLSDYDSKSSEAKKLIKSVVGNRRIWHKHKGTDIYNIGNLMEKQNG